MANKLNLGRVKGTDGTPGTPGTHGKDGKSAYQAAVDAGYTGTEADFNAALLALKGSPFLPLSGGTMTGRLNMGGQMMVNVSSISGSSGPVTIGSGIILDGSKINNVGYPSEVGDAANKAYVDKAITAAIGDAIGGSY